jgi:ABC-type transport system substrate-binding protein
MTMLSGKRLAIIMVLMMIALITLSACDPTPESKVVYQTVQVEVTKVVGQVMTGAPPRPTEPLPLEPTEPPTPEPTDLPPPEPRIYRLGIFEDPTASNYWAYMDPDSSVWNGYVFGATSHPSFWRLAYPDILFVPYMARELPREVVQEGDFWVQTIEIHPGVKWSDGAEVTVNDLIFTGETVRNFGLGGSWLSSFNFEIIDHFEAVDDYTIKITYSQEPGLSVSQVGGLGFAPWMPKHYWEEKVADAARSDDPAAALYDMDSIGEPTLGAFTLTSWEPGASAELTAVEGGFFDHATSIFYKDGSYREFNDNYEFCIYGDCSGGVKLEYTSGPYVPNVIFDIYDTQEAAVQALANGEVDFLLNPLGLQRDLEDQVMGNPDLAAFQNPPNGFRYLAFNTRRSPNSYREFRQAVATLIDKEYIAGDLLQNTAIPVYAMVPEENVFWHNPDVPTLGKGLSRKERVAQAKDLLKSAGFGWDVEPEWDVEDGAVVPGSTLKDPDGNELQEIELLTPSEDDDPMRATTATWIAQWCNELGIPVKLNTTGFGTIIPQVFEPDLEMGEIEFDWYILGWGLGSPALPEFHEALFACANDAKDGGLNTSGYCDEEFDALAQGFRSAKTLEDARTYVWAMEGKLAEDQPYVTLFTAPILEFYAAARVEVPFLETLDGLQNLNGLPASVKVR